MALNATNFALMLRSLLPRGRAWTAEMGTTLWKLLAGAAQELYRVHGRTVDLLRESDPRETAELLADWERVFGLPDSCSRDYGTVEERRQQLLYKIATPGGQSRAHFVEICRQFGYDVEIREFRKFQAGRSQAGDPCCDQAWLFYWEANADEFQVTQFRAGAGRAGDPIRTWSNDVLECILNRKKPAHTQVRFTYGS